MMGKMIELPTAGEILKDEFMDPLGVSAYRLARKYLFLCQEYRQ